MKQFFQFILARVQERSTWLGIISVAAALGLTLSSGQSDAIVAAGLGLGGLITAFTKDTTPPPAA